MKIGFITGARSEYGVMKNVIRSLAADDRFNVCIIATGMHFQKKYGYTVSEIENDNLAPVVPIPCYTEEQREKSVDFYLSYYSLIQWASTIIFRCRISLPATGLKHMLLL